MTDITHLSSISRPLPGTYADFVKALKKPGDAILASLTGKQADLLHMAIGLSGEAAELLAPFLDADDDKDFLIDRNNVVEELGDLEFFLEGIYDNVGWEREEPDEAVVAYSRRNILDHLILFSGNILDTVKRHAIYGKDLDHDKLELDISGFEASMAEFYMVTGVTREEVINHNVNKLATRYASLSYSDQQAQDRADKA